MKGEGALQHHVFAKGADGRVISLDTVAKKFGHSITWLIILTALLAAYDYSTGKIVADGAWHLIPEARNSLPVGGIESNTGDLDEQITWAHSGHRCCRVDEEVIGTAYLNGLQAFRNRHGGAQFERIERP